MLATRGRLEALLERVKSSRARKLPSFVLFLFFYLVFLWKRPSLVVVRLSTKKKQSRWRQHGGDLNIYDELAVAPTPEPEANKKKSKRKPKLFSHLNWKKTVTIDPSAATNNKRSLYSDIKPLHRLPCITATHTITAFTES